LQRLQGYADLHALSADHVYVQADVERDQLRAQERQGYHFVRMIEAPRLIPVGFVSSNRKGNMDTQEQTHQVPTDLERFMERWNEQLEKLAVISNWHAELHVATGYELPYHGDRTSIYCNVYEYDDNSNGTVNEAATLKNIAKVVQFASSKGYDVQKKYDDDDFRATITIAEGIRVSYIANRKVVCTPKVVGKKFHPAVMIPAQAVDVVEWECDKLSFLAIDTDG
jgi:hypothetical protein